jgi:hypothetical protein
MSNDIQRWKFLSSKAVLARLWWSCPSVSNVLCAKPSTTNIMRGWVILTKEQYSYITYRIVKFWRHKAQALSVWLAQLVKAPTLSQHATVRACSFVYDHAGVPKPPLTIYSQTNRKQRYFFVRPYASKSPRYTASRLVSAPHSDNADVAFPSTWTLIYPRVGIVDLRNSGPKPVDHGVCLVFNGTSTLHFVTSFLRI